MNNTLLPDNQNGISKADLQTILAEWLEAMSDFHTYYKMLVTYINEIPNEQDTISTDGLCIGQCSVTQLKALMATMKSELGKLVQQVDQYNGVGQNPAKMDYKTIIDHTSVLEQLNKEAKMKIFMASLPAS